MLSIVVLSSVLLLMFQRGHPVMSQVHKFAKIAKSYTIAKEKYIHFYSFWKMSSEKNIANYFKQLFSRTIGTAPRDTSKPLQPVAGPRPRQTGT